MAFVQVHLNGFANVAVSLFDQLSDGVAFAGSEDKVIWCNLENSPDTINKVFCMSPVTDSIKIPKRESISSRNRSTDLSSDEILAPAW